MSAGAKTGGRKGASMSSVSLAPEAPRRSRIAAGLLSLVAPGAGHLYIGRRRRGLILLALLLAIQPLLVAAAFFLPPSTFVIWAYGAVLLTALLGVTLFILIDAMRLAHRGDGSRPRWYVYVGAIVAIWTSLSAVSLLGAIVKRLLPWRTFSIPSSSMQPTLRIEEWILGDTRYYPAHAPARGDLIIYRYPADETTLYIKRIVGLPGDRIAFRDGRVILNGVPAQEPFADFGDPKAVLNTTAEVTVPPDHLFAAGDNRANSSDSRVKQHGFVPVKNLVARATEIFLTEDAERLGLWIGSPAKQ
jgi:signal peptidase I